MFEGFQDQWTPVQLGRRLRRGHVAKVRVAGEDIALFRRQDGEVGALIDTCPHRGVALSLGRVTPEGGLECPFHGWTFGPDGRCIRVPWCAADERQRARLSAAALPAREVGPLIWLFTGRDERGSEPAPAPALHEPGWVHWTYAETWRCHWTRAMENMLDFPHLPFVHRRTIGRRMRANVGADATLACDAIPEPFGMRVEAAIDGESIPTTLEWRRPNGMVLHLSAGSRRRIRQHIFCVPVDATHTAMMVIAARDFGRGNPLLWIFDHFNRFILAEDRAIVESSRPPEVPHPSEEKSVATDGPTLRFRRWYLHTQASRHDVPATALARHTAPSDPAAR